MNVKNPQQNKKKNQENFKGIVSKTTLFKGFISTKKSKNNSRKSGNSSTRGHHAHGIVNKEIKKIIVMSFAQNCKAEKVCNHQVQKISK